MKTPLERFSSSPAHVVVVQRQHILIPIILIFLSPFIFATSPTPPPYHQFHVQGVIQRPNGGTKRDFSVVLLAKPLYRTPPSAEFEILRGTGAQFDRPVAITDSVGAFSVVTSVHEPRADSIVVGVIAPERPITIGQIISVSRLQAVPNTSTYTVDDPGGCNGCESTPARQTVTTHYSYYLQDQVVVITY